MRVVLDTNILLSALVVRGTPPDRLYEEWHHGRFQLASNERQIDELRQVVHLLALERHEGTRIVSAESLVDLLGG